MVLVSAGAIISTDGLSSDIKDLADSYYSFLLPSKKAHVAIWLS